MNVLCIFCPVCLGPMLTGMSRSVKEVSPQSQQRGTKASTGLPQAIAASTLALARIRLQESLLASGTVQPVVVCLLLSYCFTCCGLSLAIALSTCCGLSLVIVLLNLLWSVSCYFINN